MPEDENGLIESKFSSGLNIVRRLDTLWKKCHELKRAGRFQDWNNELDTIWLELARDLFQKTDIKEETDQFKQAKKIFDDFDTKLKDCLPFRDGGSGFGKFTKDDIVKRNKQYKIIMDKQLFLARLENFTGKGTTAREDEDDWD